MHSSRARVAQALPLIAPLAIALGAGCGKGGVTPAPATVDRPSTTRPELEAAAEPATALTDEPEPQCDRTCAELISKAQLAFERAAALRGADSARASLARKAERGFERAWRVCLLRVPDGHDLSCEGGREVVERMVAASMMTKDVSGQVFAQLVALDPRWRRLDSPLAESAVKEQLAQLASEGERRGREDAEAEGAAAALEASAYAYLAVNRPDAANRVAAAFRRGFGRDHATEATLMAVAIAEHYVDARQGKQALGSLPQTVAPGASSPPRLRVLWHAVRSRAQLEAGNAFAAEREAKTATGIWTNVKTPVDEVGPAAPWPMLGRERVVEAVGAATYVLAEKPALEATALRPPRYSGPPTHAGMSDFMQTKVAAWARKKLELIRVATHAYAAAADIRPVPPGRWMVAGTTRVGELNAELADQMTSLALPPPLANDETEQRSFDRAMLASVAPVVAASRAAFERCVEFSEKYRLSNGEREYCHERLNGLPSPE